MAVDEPSWWYAERPHWQALLLAPVAALYGRIAARRMRSPPGYHSALPVVCIGNFTAGGTGKTPTALKVAEMVRSLSRTPVFLSRGYGGTNEGPVIVAPDRHTAGEVGDEPLLLARSAMTVVARDRAKGAALIEASASADSVIIMDDGFQNSALRKDLSIVIVDAQRRLGNGRVIPSGPLRAPIAEQARRADIVLVNGACSEIDRRALIAALAGFSGDLIDGHVAPAASTLDVKDRRFLAFAGIANPARFFSLLSGLGATLAETIAFADHHDFTTADADRLVARATALEADLITTEKDFARLAGGEEWKRRLRERCQILRIALVLDQDGERRLSAALKRHIDPKGP